MGKEKAELLVTFDGGISKTAQAESGKPFESGKLCSPINIESKAQGQPLQRNVARMPSILSLDTICNAANYFAGQWTPELRRNQSRDLLRLVLSKMYFPSQGNLFHARIRASHAGLGNELDLSREWTCTLVGKLRQARWLETSAPRRAGSNQQEVTVFRPGKRLKRLLVMLLKSKQRAKPSVNTPSQFFPRSQKQEQKQTDKQTDGPIPSGLVDGLVKGIAKNWDMNTKTGW